jgi:hypothetical protein
MTLHFRTLNAAEIFRNVHFIHSNCSVIMTHYKLGRGTR